MLKKVSIAAVPSEKDFEFNFEINGRNYFLVRKGVTEKMALDNLYMDLLEIISDIKSEFTPTENETVPRKKITTPLKEKVVVEEAPMVQNGIKFNTPKVVNNPGFQPKFIEKVD